MTSGTWYLQLPAPASEWEVVGFSDDPVPGADLDRVAEARRRYTGVAQTIESAVARLKSITTSEDQLKGEYADALRKNAEKVHEQLAKAGVRYTDVAEAIAVYQPELEDALKETRGGLEDAKAAKSALTTAEGLPGGEPDDQGVLDDAAVAADADKARQVGSAQTALTAAKSRVQTAFDRLQVAGKRLGDAVTARNYDDGLTDSGWDKAIAVLKKISKVLAIIGMVLAVLCFVFPGVAALLAVAAVVAVAALGVAAVLYAKGAEGLPDLIFAVLGVVLLGGAVWATSLTRFAGTAGRGAQRTNIRMNYPTPAPNELLGHYGRVIPVLKSVPLNWKSMSDFFDNGLSRLIMRWAGRPELVPEVGFWKSSLTQLKDAAALWGQMTSWRAVPGVLKQWGQGFLGISQFRNIQQLHGGSGLATSPWWAVWGGGNSIFTFGTGLVWTGGRTEWRDWRDQWIPDYRPGGDE